MGNYAVWQGGENKRDGKNRKHQCSRVEANIRQPRVQLCEQLRSLAAGAW